MARLHCLNFALPLVNTMRTSDLDQEFLNELKSLPRSEGNNVV